MTEYAAQMLGAEEKLYGTPVRNLASTAKLIVAQVQKVDLIYGTKF